MSQWWPLGGPFIWKHRGEGPGPGWCGWGAVDKKGTWVLRPVEGVGLRQEKSRAGEGVPGSGNGTCKALKPGQGGLETLQVAGDGAAGAERGDGEVVSHKEFALPTVGN